MTKVELYIADYRERLARGTMPKRIDFSDVYSDSAPARQRPARSFTEWKARRAAKQAGGVNMTTAGATVDRARDAAGLTPAQAWAREWERAAADKHPVMLAAIRDGSVRDYGAWKALRLKLGIGGVA